MIRVRIKTDLSQLDKLEKTIQPRAERSVREAAEALVRDIRSNWSSTSPSLPGNAPAIDTGNLDSSVRAERTGRDEEGRFASTNDAAVWFVRIATSEGDNPNGRGDYAEVLENEMNRPFVDPAIRRMQAIFPHFFRALFD